jgi:membrane peptidoglycan carboxypeptidase
LNVVELGRNIYGVEAAAQHYFGSPPLPSIWWEAATLAALCPAAPFKERSLAARRNIILNRLASVGYLSQSENQMPNILPGKKVEEAERCAGK